MTDPLYREREMVKKLTDHRRKMVAHELMDPVWPTPADFAVVDQAIAYHKRQIALVEGNGTKGWNPEVQKAVGRIDE